MIKRNHGNNNKHNNATDPSRIPLAMLRAQRHLPHAKAFLYMDSDAVVTTQGNHSMTDVLAYIRQTLHWDVRQQPIAFNQDGPGWACSNVVSTTGYDFCFNSGTVFWRRSLVVRAYGCCAAAAAASRVCPMQRLVAARANPPRPPPSPASRGPGPARSAPRTRRARRP